MYLFSRQGRLSGARFRDSVAWATEAAQRVSQTTGLEVGLWSRMFSPGVGTLVWATFVPDLATMEAANDKLMVDDGINSLFEKGNDFIIPGTMDDALATVISGTPDPNRAVEYVATVEATIHTGKGADGIELGVEIAQRAERVMGLPSMFVANQTGNYGSVAWITGFADVAELERAQTALNSDESFVEFIDKKAKGVYNDTPGAATQLIYRRIPT
jgi:hypothetical protein